MWAYMGSVSWGRLCLYKTNVKHEMVSAVTNRSSGEVNSGKERETVIILRKPALVSSELISQFKGFSG